MTLARVVSFNGVNAERMAALKNRIETDGQPEGLNSPELLLLHDPDSEQALAVLFFDNEDDYAAGDAILNAMPSDETPGQRAAVTKYHVAARMLT